MQVFRLFESHIQFGLESLGAVSGRLATFLEVTSAFASRRLWMPTDHKPLEEARLPNRIHDTTLWVTPHWAQNVWQRMQDAGAARLSVVCANTL